MIFINMDINIDTNANIDGTDSNNTNIQNNCANINKGIYTDTNISIHNNHTTYLFQLSESASYRGQSSVEEVM